MQKLNQAQTKEALGPQERTQGTQDRRREPEHKQIN